MKTILTITMTSFILLMVCCDLVEVMAKECKSVRPGSELYRTLLVPEKMDMKNSSKMVNALCCIYTRVERSDDVDNFTLVTYDKSKETHQKNNFKDAYESVKSSICSMYMGAEDCNNKSQCMKKALKSTWMDNFKASFKKYTSHTCGDSGNNYSTEYSGMRKCIKSCAKDENCMGLEIVPINNQYKCTKYTEIPSQSKVNPTNRKYRCYTKDN